MLNANDLNNTIAFLRRVQLSGEESMAHAELMIKFNQMLQDSQKAQQQALEPTGEGIDQPPPGNGKEGKNPPPAGKQN